MKTPVIDIHEHLAPRRVFRSAENLKRKEFYTTAEDLVSIMDRKGIDHMAVLPLVSPEGTPLVQTIEEVFEACDRFPGRFIKFCNLDPRTEWNALDYDFVPLLKYCKSLGARGLGEMTANLWWHDPRVQNLLRGCEETGLPFLFHLTGREFNTYGLIDQPGLKELEEALKRYPRLQLIGHAQAFWAEVGPSPTGDQRAAYPTGKVAEGGRVPELLRKYPNLRGELSADSGYNAVSRDPAWGYRFIEEFQDRLLLGLDIVYTNNDRCPLLDFLRDAVKKKKISRAAFDKVMGGNAVRLLGL